MFDASIGIVVYSNNFDTGRTIFNPDRLWVTKNGLRLAYGEGYTPSGSVVQLTGPIIGSGDVVVITSFTQTVVPAAIEFRIFQDMLGNQVLYRMTEDTSTKLVADLGPNDDIIYVDNASHLSQPNLPIGIFGVITINGERITYRNRDVVANTVSGLRRGVAGTGAGNEMVALSVEGIPYIHVTGSTVYDIGRGEALPAPYQQRIRNNTFIGDGTTSTYLTDLSIDYADSTVLEDAVRVRVGGTELLPSEFAVSSTNPITVDLVNTPETGVEVNIYIVQANVMYAQGIDTASNGIALQEQRTQAANFIRGFSLIASAPSPTPIPPPPPPPPTGAPVIDVVSPPVSPEAGGGTAYLIGTGMTGVTSVSFGGVPATEVTVIDDFTVTATIPAGTGSVSVTATNAFGTGTWGSSFTYY